MAMAAGVTAVAAVAVVALALTIVSSLKHIQIRSIGHKSRPGLTIWMVTRPDPTPTETKRDRNQTNSNTHTHRQTLIEPNCVWIR